MCFNLGCPLGGNLKSLFTSNSMPMDVGGPATVTVHVAVAHNPLVSHTWYTLSVVPTKSAAGTNVMAPVAGSTVTVPGMLPASVNTVAVVGSSSALPALSLPTTSTVTGWFCVV